MSIYSNTHHMCISIYILKMNTYNFITYILMDDTNFDIYYDKFNRHGKRECMLRWFGSMWWYMQFKGVCDSISNSCKCFYECSQPKPQVCSVGIGTCSAVCNDQCCDQNCATKFPGASQAYGVCYNVGPAIYSYCLCFHNCWNLAYM